jgi:hypothetical protein
MPAVQAIALVQLGVPGSGALGNKVGLEGSRFPTESGAHDLFHFALVQINARTKHGSNVESETGNSMFISWIPDD